MSGDWVMVLFAFSFLLCVGILFFLEEWVGGGGHSFGFIVFTNKKVSRFNLILNKKINNVLNCTHREREREREKG